MLSEIVNTDILFLVVACTVLIYIATYLSLYTKTQKILYSLFVAFYFLYNGLGISFEKGVHDGFFSAYLQLLVSVSVTFFFVGKLFLGTTKKFVPVANSFLKYLLSKKLIVYGVLFIYFFASFLYLCYPEFKVMNIINPPAPSVLEQFEAKMRIVQSGGKSGLLRIIDYINYLIYPFYLIVLSHFRKKPFILFILLFIPLYFHYINISYINRGKVLETFFIYGAMLWYYTPKIRKYIIVFSLIVFPLLPGLLLNYANIRSGVEAQEYNKSDALQEIVIAESVMPTFSNKIWKSEKSLNKINYYRWLFTLPIPKILIGQVPTASAASEMSEILLNKKFGTKGYFALLAGLVNEAKYIYGANYAFIHGLLIGSLMAFLARLCQDNPFLFPVVMVFAVLFSYNLNRAGVASTVPQVINRFFALYVVLGAVYFSKRVKLT